MPMQSRTSLAALMTLSLAVAAPLVFTQIDIAEAQSGGGGSSGGSAGAGGTSGAGGTGTSAGGTSGGSTTGSGTTSGSSAGTGTGSGTSAGDRGGSGTGRAMGDTPRPGMTNTGPGMSNTQPGTMDRDYSTGRGMTNRGSTGSSMQGSSGTDATTRSGMRGTGEDGSLVGTEKLNAAVGALDGSSTTRGRRGATTARVVQMEEYETAMRNALAIEDPSQRSAAVAEARERLQRATSRQVSPEVIARVDSILGLPSTTR